MEIRAVAAFGGGGNWPERHTRQFTEVMEKFYILYLSGGYTRDYIW